MTGFFDRALAAADDLKALVDPNDDHPERDDAIVLVTRALREAVALNRGIRAEAEQARQRLADAPRVTLSELSVDDLLAELRRRLT